MAEGWTYFGYREGLDPSILRLGNMVLDYGNPRTKIPYIHASLSTNELEQSVTADNRPFAHILHQSGRGCRLGGGVLNLADLNWMQADTEYTLVSGKNASKKELIRPEKFFEDIILRSDEARHWLSSRLAISRKLKILKNLTFQKPSIWLLTGIYMIEDATTVALRSTSNGIRISASVPIPDPSMITTLQQLAINGMVNTTRVFSRMSASQILGSRVWAAQYQKIDARYVTLEAQGELSSTRITLANIFSVQEQRGGSAADVTVAEEFAGNEDPGQDIDDEQYWVDFETEARKCDDQFAEDSD